MNSEYEPTRVLFQTHIKDFALYEGLSVIDELKLGTKLELRHEPDNPNDSEAVAVYFESLKIGYVPLATNNYIYTMLYFGHDLFDAQISMVDNNEHPDARYNVIISVIDRRK